MNSLIVYTLECLSAGQHNFLSNTRESVWERESLEIQIERRHLSTFVLFLCSSLVFVCQRWDLRLAQLSQPFGIPSWVELRPLSLSNKSDWREEDRRELWIKTPAACINDYTSNKSLQGGVVPLHLNHLSLCITNTPEHRSVCLCLFLQRSLSLVVFWNNNNKAGRYAVMLTFMLLCMLLYQMCACGCAFCVFLCQWLFFRVLDININLGPHDMFCLLALRAFATSGD